MKNNRLCRHYLLLVLVFVTGCASVATPPPVLIRPAQIENKPFVIAGRIVVKHKGERTSATVRWTHSPQKDEILLFAPLGKTVARIHTSADEVTLDTPNKHYAAPDVESLMQQVLGWSLPLAGLRYWVFAMPAPDSSFEMQSAPNGQVNQLLQEQWIIHYPRYAGTTPDSLPSHITLLRGELSIQLLIDEWEVGESW
ncbi:MAG: lipoprotein insertase outer membrane protein LolB [Candidatus Nitrotoga sp.]